MLEHLAAELGPHQRLALELTDAVRRMQPSVFADPLTEREQVVLCYLPTLMSNAEIAESMHLSVNTVKTHLKALYRKLQRRPAEGCRRAGASARIALITAAPVGNHGIAALGWEPPDLDELEAQCLHPTKQAVQRGLILHRAVEDRLDGLDGGFELQLFELGDERSAHPASHPDLVSEPHAEAPPMSQGEQSARGELSAGITRDG